MKYKENPQKEKSTQQKKQSMKWKDNLQNRKKLSVNHISEKELISKIYKELIPQELSSKKKNNKKKQLKVGKQIDMIPKIYKWPTGI